MPVLAPISAGRVWSFRSHTISRGADSQGRTWLWDAPGLEQHPLRWTGRSWHPGSPLATDDWRDGAMAASPRWVTVPWESHRYKLILRQCQAWGREVGQGILRPARVLLPSYRFTHKPDGPLVCRVEGVWRSKGRLGPQRREQHPSAACACTPSAAVSGLLFSPARTLPFWLPPGGTIHLVDHMKPGSLPFQE